MESCRMEAVLPLVGLPAEKVIRDQYKRPTTGSDSAGGRRRYAF
ncbi:MAG: hypothetical protein ACQESR_30610 [Planctomycetota bacterium]